MRAGVVQTGHFVVEIMVEDKEYPDVQEDDIDDQADAGYRRASQGNPNASSSIVCTHNVSVMHYASHVSGRRLPMISRTRPRTFDLAAV